MSALSWSNGDRVVGSGGMSGRRRGKVEENLDYSRRRANKRTSLQLPPEKADSEKAGLVGGKLDAAGGKCVQV